MTRTFTNTGNCEVAYVFLGNEHGADPIAIQANRGASTTVTLTEGQERNLVALRAENPGFFETEMKITP